MNPINMVNCTIYCSGLTPDEVVSVIRNGQINLHGVHIMVSADGTSVTISPKTDNKP